MTLLPHHRDRLAMIADDILDAVGVCSAEVEDDLPVGFRGWDKITLPAIVFPWHGAGGNAVVQVRPDDPVDAEHKYLTLAGTVMPLGVHPVMRTRVIKPDVPIVIVEGTKQYLTATSALIGRDWAVVGITGCEGWSVDGLPVPDFEAIPWEGRRVVVCFDADVTSNRDVWEAAKALATVLESAGANEVRHARIPARGTAGLDDYLRTVTDRTGHLERILARAGSLGRAPARKRKERNSAYILPDAGLQVATLAADLRHRYPMAVARDRSIAIYAEGVFHTGRSELGDAVAGALGEDFRRTHLRDVEEFLTHRLSGEGLELPEHAREPILNVSNGMLNLLTGMLEPHDPAHLSYVQIPLAWDPDATCPRYEDWLAERVGSQVDDLEEVTATMLDPSRTPPKAILLYGPSRSGKSTWIRLMEAVAGARNTSGVSLHQLSDNKFMAARVYGKMLNCAADLTSAHVNDLSTFKKLTGDDIIEADTKYGHPIVFHNRALFAFSANTIPTVGETSTAYFERIKPFEFPHSFAGTEDPKVEQELLEELPGILARWVKAFQRLRLRGRYLPTDEAVRQRFEERSDRVRRWLSQEMKVVPAVAGQKLPPGAASTKTELHRAFSVAAERDGGAKMGLQTFLDHVQNCPGVVEVRRLPGSIRALNVIKRDESGPSGDDNEKSGAMGAVLTHPPQEGWHWLGGGSQCVPPWGGWEKVAPTAPVATIAFDLETASVDDLWSYGPGFVRLAGYRNGSGVVTTTTDVTTIPPGATLVGHNVFGFDLLALARYHGLDLTTVRALDTKVLAFLADPPPAKLNEGQIERYYSLDSVGERLFGIGKEGDLKALAKEFGGFDRIPVDDGRYLDYLRRDVELTARIADAIPLTPYAEREHEVARIAAIMSTSGFRVDERLLRSRVADGAGVREEMLAKLSEYGLPTTRKDGSPVKAPQSTEEGRAAIVAAFTDLGVELPLTPKGKPALGQKAMALVIEEHPRAKALAETVRSLNGVRTIYETIAAHLVDGRVHPMVNLRQATGRWSVTRPGLTVMGKRGGRHVEREVFLAEEGEVLIAADLSQIDARAIAALSQDPAYLDLFLPGRDAHREIAERVWGDAGRREEAKVITHGWSYGMGVEGIVRNTGVSMDTAQEFDRAMREQFPDLVAWRKKVREQARAGEMLDNGFGRMMRPDPDRAHTQGPALMGQGCARDLLMTGLLRLPTELLPMLRAVIHDEVVLSVPADSVDEIERAVLEALCFDWIPPGGLLGVQVVAGLVGRGSNWGAVYEKGSAP